jgi:hypothetical protein
LARASEKEEPEAVQASRGGTYPHAGVMMQKAELRPVLVDMSTDSWNGLFHCWAVLESKPIALVETAKGEVRYIDAYRIVFIHPKFNEYCFDKARPLES